MRKLLGTSATAVAALLLVLGTTSLARAGDADEAAIKTLEENLVKGIQTKDIALLMSGYEQSPDLIIFDLIPPRQYVGWDAYKKDWQGVLDGCKGPIQLELTDLSITAGAKVAFAHNIQHFSCTGTDGKTLDFTMRVTDGYRKVKGKWLITHEHISTPIDLATGKADLTSKP